MPNRFAVRRRNTVIAGCVFCAIAVGLALTGGAQAAMIMSQVTASGTQFMGGDSALLYEISTSNHSGPPLVCGQEVVSMSAVDRFLSSGAGKYQNGLALENSDLIVLQSERLLSLDGPGVYHESLLYDGVGAGNPEGGCGGEEFAAGAGGGENETIPATDPYCSMFIASTGLMGSGLQYQSLGISQVGDLELPDAVGFQFAATGNGVGTLDVGSMSITPYYSNQFSEHLISGGKPFNLEGKFQFSSFALTFDQPTEEEA